jgi:hypothetical protein
MIHVVTKKYRVYTACAGGTRGGYVNLFPVSLADARIRAEEEKRKPWNKVVKIVECKE